MKLTKEKLKQIIREELEGIESWKAGEKAPPLPPSPPGVDLDFLRKEPRAPAHNLADRPGVYYLPQFGTLRATHNGGSDYAIMVTKEQLKALRALLPSSESPQEPTGGKTFEVPGGDITYSGTNQGEI